MSQFRSLAFRLTIGAAAGALGWLLLHAAFPWFPEPLRFAVGFGIFTFGPGVAIAGALSARLDPLRRAIVILGAGSAAAPLLVDLLGRMHAIDMFPFVTAALTGAGLAAWRRSNPQTPEAVEGPRTGVADAIAGATIVALALALGFVVFSHRLETGRSGVQVFGDYDSADMSWYSAVASEASHTVPPTASYYSGHALNAAYYAHLVAAMINRFCDVPILSIFFRYAWPTYVTLGSLAAFALVRSIASTWTALLAVVFILTGSDFSYLAAWYLPHATVDWDYLLWPTNFLSPTMQVQHFSTWSPSLPVFFTALIAIVRGLQTRALGWTLLSGFLIGILFEFKPFAYAVLIAALGAATVFARADWPARFRYVATIVLGIVCSTPFLWRAATLAPEDRRTRLVIDPFLLPKRMLLKIDLTDAFWNAADRIAPFGSLRTAVFLLLATIVFLAVGIGVRWLGIPGVWRAIRAKGSEEDASSWRLLGWVVIAGIAIPFVIATEPYVDTLQFYLTGLYILWIFTAVALMRFATKRPPAGAAAIALSLLLAFPSSGHYLRRKWTDQERPPRVALTRSELAVARYLRSTDPEKTVILHGRPLSPSLIAIVAGRRIVLGWDVRYSAVGGEGRLSEVNAFYSSATGDPRAALEMLRKHQVTHVVVRTGEDRVHPTVLAALKPILVTPDVVLYEVPQL